jgi:hypothetical protein
MAKTTTPHGGQEVQPVASKRMLEQRHLRLAAVTSFCTAAGGIAATQTGLIAVSLTLIVAAVVLALVFLEKG